MFYHNLNPALLHLGPLEVRWYGLFYVIGFILTYSFISYVAKKGYIKYTKDEIESLFLHILIGLILGARIFYILFYNFSYYLQHPMEMLQIWHGGLSFHGALIGIMIAVLLFCKKYKKDWKELSDYLIIPIPLCLMLGRIGNFINGELYGRITTVPWAVKFPNADGFRHPSQLYEAAKNLFIFIILFTLYMYKKRFPKGFFFWLFFTLYPLLRFFVEFYREPDPQLGFIAFGLSMGQLLSIIMFAVGSIMLVLTVKKPEKKSKHA